MINRWLQWCDDLLFLADVNPSWPIQAANGLRLLALTLYLWTAARFGYHETFALLMWMAREFFAGIQDVATFFRPGGQHIPGCSKKI